jgi:hypothetical protein
MSVERGAASICLCIGLSKADARLNEGHPGGQAGRESVRPARRKPPDHSWVSAKRLQEQWSGASLLLARPLCFPATPATHPDFCRVLAQPAFAPGSITVIKGLLRDG